MLTNEDIIRSLYAFAEASSKDTDKFISLFAEDGYFYDVPGGRKYYGKEIGLPVDAMVAAFPDMHRKLYDIYVKDDAVIVELALQGIRIRTIFRWPAESCLRPAKGWMRRAATCST